MTRYEYKVVPAPAKGKRSKGVKGPEARFAFALQTIMNTLGADGWEYLRTDTLPSEERAGLTGSKTVYRNMLVFRRLADATFEDVPLLEAPSEDELAEDELVEEVSDDTAEHDAVEEAGDEDQPNQDTPKRDLAAE